MASESGRLIIFLLSNWLIIVLHTPASSGRKAEEVNIDLKEHLQPNDIGRNEMYDTIDDNENLCTRNCEKYPEPRICYYKLVVEQYHSMGPACDGCPEHSAKCFTRQCVVADGFEKSILTFNRMVPGPAMHVCVGDRMIVDIHNRMPARSLTVHWHGNLFTGAPWMDGVAYVSQCPINEGEVFRYDFIAETVGTHFYHSHTGFQMFDGLVGAFVVREAKNSDPQKHLYDHDYPSHTILVQDWLHLMSDNKYPGYNKDKSLITLKPDCFLINGLGSYREPSETVLRKIVSSLNPLNYFFPGLTIPKAVFHVEPGKRYRFRIIAAASLTCAFRLTIERHHMVLVAMDGVPVKAVTIRSATMTSGDLFDVVITTDQIPFPYKILVEGLNECTGSTQTAILSYRENGVPRKIKNVNIGTSAPDFNSLSQGCANPRVNLCMEHLHSFGVPDDLLKSTPDYSIVLNAVGYQFSDKDLYESDQYPKHYLPFAGPSLDGGAYTDTFNRFACVMPPFPLLLKDYDFENLLCPKTCSTVCECLHLIKVPLGTVVQVAFTDDTSDEFVQMEHPMHIHGHKLIILKQGDGMERKNINLEKYELGGNRTPVIRDTVSVPPFGFAVVRFLADNPGFWPFHCHFPYHNQNGMAVIFQVGERSQFKSPPADLPTCGNYVPPV